ncbi:MAG: hypothetical protein QUV06_10270 [Cyanobium sp. CZS 48M]|nr:hypothetical protein [Cyanobium sp. CZS48M]
MSLLSRLLGRRHSTTSEAPLALPTTPAPPVVNRLVDTLPSTDVDLPIEVVAWTVRRLQGIFSQLNESPNQQALEDGQAARLCFTRFWLTAPVDLLETLYEGPIGQAYRLMLSGVLPALPLNAEEQRWKTGLSQRLAKAFGSHETTNLLLAVMPYYDLNSMRVSDPLRQIPEWLQADYAERCDPQFLQVLRSRQAKRSKADQPASQPALLAPSEAPAVARTLPLLSERRGSEAMTLIQDNEFLGRMSGLINLYAIDPSDAELKAELSALRRQVAQIWLDVDTPQLEDLYRTPFGQLTQNLIGSGFSREPLAADEEVAKRQLGLVVGEMSHPRAVNALLAALLFYSPKKVNFSGSERLVPSWLLQELQQLRQRMSA